MSRAFDVAIPKVAGAAGVLTFSNVRLVAKCHHESLLDRADRRLWEDEERGESQAGDGRNHDHKDWPEQGKEGQSVLPDHIKVNRHSRADEPF